MSAAGMLLGVAFCWLVGFALLRAVTGRDEAMTRELEIGAAFPIGAGIVGYVAYLQVLFAWPIPFFAAVAAGVAASLYILIRTRECARAARSMPAWLGLLIIIITAAALFLAIRLPYHGGDGIWVHSFKAKHLLRDNTWVNAIFMDPLVVHSNETTPLWCASLLRFMAIMGGGWSAPWPHVSLVFFFPSLALILYGSIKETFSAKNSALIAAAIILAPAYAMRFGGVFSHYVDVPLSAILTVGVVFVSRHFRTSARGSLTVVSVIVPILVTIKNEGLLLSAGLALFVLIEVVRSRMSRDHSRPAILAFFLCAWPLPFHFISRSFFSVTHDAIWFRNLHAMAFFENAERVPVILFMMAREFVRVDSWGLAWAAFWSVFLWSLRKYKIHKDLSTLVYLLPILLMIGSTFLIYWQDWMDYRQHIQWSFDRLLLQIFPCAALWLVSVFRQLSGEGDKD